MRKVLERPVLALFQRSHLPVEVLAKEEDDGDRVVALYALAQQQPCVLVVNAWCSLIIFQRRLILSAVS